MLPKIVACLVLSGLALASGLPTGTAYAQDTKKVINAGVINYYPPLEFKDPQTGELTGFDIELFKAVAKKIGATANFVEFSFADLASFAPLKTGRVDIYASGTMTDTPERRENGVSFIDYVYDPYFFFTLSANADQFKNPEGLCGKRITNTRVSQVMIAAVDRWNDENCTKAGKPAVVLVGAATNAEQQLNLKQSRADAGFTSALLLAYQNKLQGNVYQTLGKPLIKSVIGMAFLSANANTELADSVKKALDELIADGTYAQLLHKWGLTEDDSSIGKASSINAGPSLNVVK